MKHHATPGHHLPLLAATLGLVSLLVSAVPSAATRLPSKHRTLSMTSIAFVGAQDNAFFSAMVTAQQRGFFRQQGIQNVTLLNVSSSGANAIATMVGGSAQFTAANATSTLNAIQSGGPIRAIFALNYGSEDEIAINANFAAAHKIPSIGDTKSSALSMFLAFRGSHMVIGQGSTSGDNYNNLIYLLKQHGMTAGPSGDVNVVVTGNASALQAAIASGQVNAIGSIPPTTVVTSPSVVTLELGKLSPISRAYGNLISTTTAMIQAHADTVQATVNALTEAYNVIVKHPGAAEQASSTNLASLGTTSPEEQQYLFAHYQQYTVGATPALTKAGFQVVAQTIEEGQGTPITVTYGTEVDNKFVDRAIRAFGYPYAAS